MKNLFAILALAMLLSASNAFAQIAGQEFSAKDGYATALAEISAVMTNPELVFIAIESSSDPEAQFEMKYNTDNGKATAWIYVFRDSDIPSITGAVIVVKALIFFGITISPEDMELDIPIAEEGAFVGTDWMNSTDANTEFLKCEAFATYIAANPSPDGLQVAMFYNAMYPSMPMGEPFWGARIQVGNSELTSSVQTITKQLYCETIMISVLDQVAKLQQIDINHFANSVSLKSSSDLAEDVHVSIFSIDGALLFEQTYSNLSASSEINIPLDSYLSGTYIVSAKSNTSFGVKTIVVAK